MLEFPAGRKVIARYIKKKKRSDSFHCAGLAVINVDWKYIN